MNDINFQLGSVNPSGIGDVAYLIPKRDIKQWPTIDDNFIDILQGHYAEYDGDFILRDGKTWTRLYSTQGKGKITWDYSGETDCKVVVNKATLSYPKITNESRTFAKYSSNGDFVFIFRHDGKFYVIGSRDYRATLTPNGDSGDAAGSAKGIMVEIECPDTTPLPTYKGKIYLEEGVLDCESNTFINYNDMNTNKIDTLTDRIEGGNTIRFEAQGNTGRIHLEGTGPIVMEVSVDGVKYTTVEHAIEFNNGVAIAPADFYIGDKVRISATTLTKVIINYNDLKTN